MQELTQMWCELKNTGVVICIKATPTGLLSSPFQSNIILWDVLFHCKPRNMCSNMQLLANKKVVGKETLPIPGIPPALE